MTTDNSNNNIHSDSETSQQNDKKALYPTSTAHRYFFDFIRVKQSQKVTSV
jgi:hypothetical protein